MNREGQLHKASTDRCRTQRVDGCRSLLVRCFCAAAVLVMTVGCLTPARLSVVPKPGLPDSHLVTQQSLMIHSDFRYPHRRELNDRLTTVQQRLSKDLKLPESDEPINIYLFEDSRRFRHFLRNRYPSFPDRRAFFLKSADQLVVFVHWNPLVAEDLQHEVTHAYLHRVMPDVPIWLDEGIAEYYEVAPGLDGLNRQHAHLLVDAMESNQWTPDLAQLEALRDPGQLNQLHYAEAWLWVHFMQHHNAATRQLLQQQLARIRMSPAATPFYPVLKDVHSDIEQAVVAHLEKLATELSKTR